MTRSTHRHAGSAFVSLLTAVLVSLATMVWLAAPSGAVAGDGLPVAKVSVKVFSPSATVAHATAVSVSVSRGRIAGLTFDTDGLTAITDWTFAGRTASGTVTWHTVGTGHFTVNVKLSSGTVVHGTISVPVTTDVTADASLPRYQLVYLYPSDRDPVDGRARAIAHEALMVDEWFAGQLSGASPRFALNLVGQPSVLSLAAPVGADQLGTSSDLAAELVAKWRAEGVIGPTTIPIVYVDGRQTKLQAACGWYETPVDVIVVPLGNCSIEPTEGAVFPYSSTAILAHEIVHSLGALTDQAAQPDGSGRHTTDDPSDILYDGPQQHDWENLTLDPGKDDYVGGGQNASPAKDIQNSPYLEDDDNSDDHENNGNHGDGNNGNHGDGNNGNHGDGNNGHHNNNDDEQSHGDHGSSHAKSSDDSEESDD